MSYYRETSEIMEYGDNASENLVVSYYFLEPPAHYANGGSRNLDQRIAVKSDIGPRYEPPRLCVAECGGRKIRP